MVNTRRRIWLNVLLLLMSVASTLTVLEFVARRSLPLEPYAIIPEPADAEPIGRRHPTRGHDLRPNFRGHFVHPQFSRESVEINGLGFRGREPEATPDPDAVRIAVLGDSVTFGFGVEAEETFSALTEELLGERWGRPVRTFNLGVAGYGALHEWVVLQEEARRHAPDVAVVAFYTGNDLQDVFGFYHEKGAIVDLLEHFASAEIRSDRKVGKNVVEIDGERRKVFTAHPETEIRIPIQPEWVRPDAKLRLGVALRPETWEKRGPDGVGFEVRVETPRRPYVLYEQHIDPQGNPALRGWNEREVKFAKQRFLGGTLVFRTDAGPKGSFQHDRAVWVEPHLFFEDAVDFSFEEGVGESFPSRLLLKPVFKDYWQRFANVRAERPIRAYLKERSSLFRWVSGRLDHLAVRWRFKPPRAIFNYSMISAFERDMSEHIRVGLDQTMRTLSEMQAFMHARQGELVLLLIPAKFQTEPETVRRFVERAGFDPGAIDVEQPHRILMEFCERSGMTCIDSLPELRRQVAAGERVYFQEGHPNRLGHRVIAEQLAAAIER